MEGGGQAYGAGKAGGPFDPLAYVKKPQVIIRAVCLFFAIIVFGCISSQAYYEGKCLYNEVGGVCSFGIAVGVLAFLGCAGFLVLDAIFETHISSVQHRKYVVIGDIVFSGVWAFLYFISFCVLTDNWRKSKFNAPGYGGRSGTEAAIAFSFFSIAGFAGLTVLAVLRYRKGASEAFQSGYEPDGVTQPAPSPYSSYPSGGGATDPYQSPPFNQEGMQQQQGVPPGEFQQPTY